MEKIRDCLKDSDFQGEQYKKMLTISEILIQQHKMKTYKDLKEFISKKIDEGEMFLSLDIKPNFDDTPDYWETELENLFTSPKK